VGHVLSCCLGQFGCVCAEALDVTSMKARDRSVRLLLEDDDGNYSDDQPKIA